MNKRPLTFVIVLGLIAAGLAGFRHYQEQQWRLWIGQKIMPDLRYFCTSLPVAVADADPVRATENSCKQAVTTISPELAQLLRHYQFGGVVLFSLNIEEQTQLQQLTKRLQETAIEWPMWIAVDQEGGRVARLPEAMAPAFAGNMAIGATAAAHGVRYASELGAAQARQLTALGLNVNFAPSVDINSNPLNPVINVRSFGDDATQVAKLGNAVAHSLQQHGVLATFKHFPGHGDTATDSHTGLPLVSHTAEQAATSDLLPFRLAIDSGVAKAVMTAHIQYPALDNNQIHNNQGELMVAPATLSRRILTDLLRKQMGFDGLVFTDALNMAAISDFFSPAEAVIATFAAGADVALMPLEIRSPADSAQIEQLIRQVLDAMHDGRLNIDEMQASYQRIIAAKQQLLPLTDQTALRQDEQQAHLQLEANLQRDSITVVRGEHFLPLVFTERLVLLMPDQDKCQQISQALHQAKQQPKAIVCRLTGDVTPVATNAFDYQPSDLLIAAIISPKQSAVELGVLSDLQQQQASSSQQPVDEATQLKFLQQELARAKQQGARTVSIALRTPYPLQDLSAQSDILIATYGYSYLPRGNGEPPVLYPLIAQLLTGQWQATGQLPVQLKLPSVEMPAVKLPVAPPQALTQPAATANTTEQPAHD